MLLVPDKFMKFLVSQVSIAGKESMGPITFMAWAASIIYLVYTTSIVRMVSMLFLACLFYLGVIAYEAYKKPFTILVCLVFLACQEFTRHIALDDLITDKRHKKNIRVPVNFAISVSKFVKEPILSFAFEVVIAGYLILIAYEAYKEPALTLAHLVSSVEQKYEEPVLFLVSVVFLALKEFLLEERVRHPVSAY